MVWVVSFNLKLFCFVATQCIITSRGGGGFLKLLLVPMQIEHYKSFICVMYYAGLYRSWRLVHANIVARLRYLNTDYVDKNVDLKTFNDTQISCKTSF